MRFHLNGYAYHILCICLVYEMYIHCIYSWHTLYIPSIIPAYTKYIFCTCTVQNMHTQSIYSTQYILHRELIILCFTWLGTRQMAEFFCFQFLKIQNFLFSGFRGTHCPPALPICICIIWWGSTTIDDAYDILCICCVYTTHKLTENTLIYQL